MNVFHLHDKIMKDYNSYIESFINIKDPDIADKVKSEIVSGKLWPAPLIQFNPGFKIYGSIEKSVEEKILEPELKHVFKNYSLYCHQVDAIKIGNEGKDFIVTSGTGSGKSLTYIATIFNDLIRNKAQKHEIRAVIVYPMNALINSQFEEINKYERNYVNSTGEKFPITYKPYTGQENQDSRDDIKENMPDILLTNYMMLELILSRMSDRSIRDSIYENLKFLVFDELHTYRGRQGADVALLIRRIKSRCKNKILCIGTSATISSEQNNEYSKKQIADVARKIFGVPFSDDQIIEEKLEYSFSQEKDEISKEDLQKAINQAIDVNASESDLQEHKTALWLEKK